MYRFGSHIIIVIGVFMSSAVAAGQDTQPEMTGHPVTFQYGPGISENLVETYVGIVNSEGCEATATDGGRSNRVRVTTNGESTLFKDPGDAAGWALERCKPPLN